MKVPKKIFSILLLTVSLLLTGCGGDVRNVDISAFQSYIYTDDDIENAFKSVKSYFKSNFDDCTLTKLGYYGDAHSDEFNEYAEKLNAGEAIIITSSFFTNEKERGDGLSKDSVYNYHWILVRNENEKWEVFDYGY